MLSTFSMRLFNHCLRLHSIGGGAGTRTTDDTRVLAKGTTGAAPVHEAPANATQASSANLERMEA